MALDTTIGGAASDSYVTLAEYAAYSAAQGFTLTGTATTQETNLRRAAVTIDASYQFKGYPVTREQARAWPRYEVGCVDGWEVLSTTIPGDVKRAQMEMAYLIQGGADPLAPVDGLVGSSRAKAGPVEVEDTFIGGKGLPRFTAIDRLLRGYAGYGQGMVAMVRG